MSVDLIRVEGLDFSYRMPREVIHAVDGVDLLVRAGELVCIYGASGSGKSSLLNLLAGILRADSGSVRILGRELVGASAGKRAKLRLENIGIVFQDFNLIDSFTAVENVMLPLVALGVDPGEARQRAQDALTRVGIGELVDRFPNQLSGGQAQRVGIARAIVGEHQVILCDEPTGALDSKTSLSLVQQLRSLVDEDGYAVVVVTHDPIVKDYATRSFDMQDGVLAPLPVED